MPHQTLKQRHREIRDTYPEDLNLRIHRALSWWQRALMAEDDDGRYIFLWIAFNAAYATQIDGNDRLSESSSFQAFLEKLCRLDTEKRIDALVWEEYSGRIRVLLDTPYVFQSFWDFHSGRISETDWQKRFERGKQKAHYALGSGNTPILLGVLFSRLYTLRNQLVHGGATWNGSVNRKQLHDCTQLLGSLVPILIELMLDNPNTLWGQACYPVIRD
ncbi:hypothetical protein ACMHYJ_16275 [Castellaniella hirudinis]|uniref:hypothetical protein n=1 Tax=Castellaniella hirudinis TaxID=1144617 RepID=UPI0039C0B5C2